MGKNKRKQGSTKSAPKQIQKVVEGEREDRAISEDGSVVEQIDWMGLPGETMEEELPPSDLDKDSDDEDDVAEVGEDDLDVSMDVEDGKKKGPKNGQADVKVWRPGVEENFPQENFRVNREMRDEILL